jgi:hypothetical protein
MKKTLEKKQTADKKYFLKKRLPVPLDQEVVIYDETGT